MTYKISIFGAGNIGSILASKFSQNNKVCVYLSEFDRKKPFYNDLKVICTDDQSEYSAKIDLITKEIQEAIDYADLLFITYPASLFKDYAEKMIPFLKEGQHLFFIPGSGGAELFFKDVVNKGVTISGLQRVHSVGRLVEVGKVVNESGIRKQLLVASIPNSFNDEARKIINDLYNINTDKLDNYLNVTLVNSNPLLHTSRLYSIFKDYKNGVKDYESLPLFYEQWSLESSEILIKMDEELISLFNKLSKIGLPVNQIKSLLEHYESFDKYSLKNKINSIRSLQGLTTPSVINNEGKFEPDLSSRYFTSDFPYGLDILISFCEYFDINCDTMRLVSSWYHKLTNTVSNFKINKYFLNIEEIISYYGK